VHYGAAVPSPYADLVARHGLAASHRLILEAVPAGARVLDVGCASGYLAAPLAERGCRVTGVEADLSAAGAARAVCERVIEGDVEAPDVRAACERAAAVEDHAAAGEAASAGGDAAHALRGFDAIVCGDVLEHLRDPWDTLAFLHTLLAPGGRVVVSLPNVAVWSARRELLRGRFPYADHGVFDRTHLRFFTRASARELVERAGLVVAEERFAPAFLPFEPALRRRLGGTVQQPLPWVARLRAAAARQRPELFALQVVLVCRRGERP
jgi:2-polyprenyl-3-methyl-5-hydroxy-6-metoxy-1,4-benzoquinol methylase